MAKIDVDEVFEWFVIIIGIVTGMMGEFPEYFWNVPPYDVPTSMKAVKAIVIPLLLILVIWLIGRLSARRHQPIAKVIAWFYMSSLTFGYCQNFFMGIGWIPLNDLTIDLGMFFLRFIPPLLIYKVIIPRYRESYPESQFLRNGIKLLVAYILAMLIYALMVSAINRAPPPRANSDDNGEALEFLQLSSDESVSLLGISHVPDEFLEGTEDHAVLCLDYIGVLQKLESDAVPGEELLGTAADHASVYLGNPNVLVQQGVGLPNDPISRDEPDGVLPAEGVYGLDEGDNSPVLALEDQLVLAEYHQVVLGVY